MYNCILLLLLFSISTQRRFRKSHCLQSSLLNIFLGAFLMDRNSCSFFIIVNNCTLTGFSSAFIVSFQQITPLSFIYETQTSQFLRSSQLIPPVRNYSVMHIHIFLKHAIVIEEDMRFHYDSAEYITIQLTASSGLCGEISEYTVSRSPTRAAPTPSIAQLCLLLLSGFLSFLSNRVQ